MPATDYTDSHGFFFRNLKPPIGKRPINLMRFVAGLRLHPFGRGIPDEFVNLQTKPNVQRVFDDPLGNLAGID